MILILATFVVVLVSIVLIVGIGNDIRASENNLRPGASIASGLTVLISYAIDNKICLHDDDYIALLEAIGEYLCLYGLDKIKIEDLLVDVSIFESIINDNPIITEKRILTKYKNNKGALILLKYLSYWAEHVKQIDKIVKSDMKKVQIIYTKILMFRLLYDLSDGNIAHVTDKLIQHIKYFSKLLYTLIQINPVLRILKVLDNKKLEQYKTIIIKELNNYIAESDIKFNGNIFFMKRFNIKL